MKIHQVASEHLESEEFYLNKVKILVATRLTNIKQEASKLSQSLKILN